MLDLDKMLEDLEMPAPAGEVLEEFLYPMVHVVPSRMLPKSESRRSSHDKKVQEHYIRNIQPLYNVPYDNDGNEHIEVILWFAVIGDDGKDSFIRPAVSEQYSSSKGGTIFLEVCDKQTLSEDEDVMTTENALMKSLSQYMEATRKSIIPWMFFCSPCGMRTELPQDFLMQLDLAEILLGMFAPSVGFDGFEFVTEHPLSLTEPGMYGGFHPIEMLVSSNGYADKPLITDGASLVHSLAKMHERGGK